MDELKSVVYSRDSIEFVTVAVQYCNFLENLDDADKFDFTDKLTKILPLLYLKASLAPCPELVNEDSQEITVQEEDYNYVLNQLLNIFGADDTYLEVFLQDMKYSDTPISASVSEDLTDIYQDLKNFVAIFEIGVTENMNDALSLCIENFKLFWGQKLVNVLRALHMIKYSRETETYIGEDEIEDNSALDLW